MPGDPYYQTPEWRALRKACVARDHGRCTTPGCTHHGFIADHIVPRTKGGQDALSNLRTLCRTCDNRRHADKGGTPRRRAVGADGWPVAAKDPGGGI